MLKLFQQLHCVHHSHRVTQKWLKNTNHILELYLDRWTSLHQHLPGWPICNSIFLLCPTPPHPFPLELHSLNFQLCAWLSTGITVEKSILVKILKNTNLAEGCRSWLFLCTQGFWEKVQEIIPHLHFLLLLYIVEISSPTLIPLFRPGSVHSGSWSWGDCGWVFPDKFGVCSVGSHTMPG